ncbi:hypothetical protein [Marinifilum fragile]|uniref:hypothetical protein n=1 Tax=Marinifilum fragile TaxID=570161 RepID=UPI002AA73E81|nr:hypothetical protein [Marinifilum fragile]
MRNIVISILLILVCFSKSVVANPNSEQNKQIIKEYISDILYAAMESYEEGQRDWNNKSISEKRQRGMSLFEEEYLKFSDWEFAEVSELLKQYDWKDINNKTFTSCQNRFQNIQDLSYEDAKGFIVERIRQPFSEKMPRLRKKYTSKVGKIRSEYLEKLKFKNEEGDCEDITSIGETSDSDGILSEDNEVSYSSEQDNIDGFTNYNRRDSIDKGSTVRRGFDIFHYLFLLIIAVLVFMCIRLRRKCITYKSELSYNQVELKGLRKENKALKSSSRSKKVETKSTVSTENVEPAVSQPKQVSMPESEMYKSNGRFMPTHAENQQKTVPVEIKKQSQNQPPKFILQNWYYEDFVQGAFNVRAGKKQKDQWSIYNITTSSEHEGSLTLIVQNNEREIIVNKENYLHASICDVSYQEGGNMDRIVKNIPGRVRLNQGKWQVIEKVKVVIA